ncbi:RNA ligase (ATP) [Hymenobacter sp. H14-R3]|uniref:RNA ligase (ATP) n=1 Tax=Hymenobacter sp. H14-R3 TaxID=3046308 RepID=UPI0024BB3F87|nr:RNA ligase (ATP) [Hymenobacter sp. H14-R3]MDJ0366591.1 RNA ligase (ATP) [Hymenobacter sp. H14-R3]
MRKLASIRKVAELKPIAGADLIELALVDGWQCVVKKNELAVGDLAVYCEVDSLLPVQERFEFLRTSSYKKLPTGAEGFRLKTMRLRGQLSQGLLLPLAVLGPLATPPLEGDDVTDLLGITKYDPPLPAALSGVAKGVFPAWLPKTDEERIQNCWADLPKDADYVITEKLHGTSATFYLRDGEFGLCSRNLDLLPDAGGLYTDVAVALDVEAKIRAYAAATGRSAGLALQGEIIGEGINGNYYRIAGRQLFLFNVFDEATGYLPPAAASLAVQHMGLQEVPVLDAAYRLPATCAAALAQAEAASIFMEQPVREGIVLRHYPASGPRVSCKIISNQHLLKEK